MPACVRRGARTTSGKCASPSGAGAGSAYARLARTLDAQTIVMVRAEDRRSHGRDGIVDVSVRDARDPACMLRALGHWTGTKF